MMSLMAQHVPIHHWGNDVT